MVQALAALGRPVEALTLLRARQSASGASQDPDQALHEARISLSIRLSCNLLTEGFMEVAIRPPWQPCRATCTPLWYCSTFRSPVVMQMCGSAHFKSKAARLQPCGLNGAAAGAQTGMAFSVLRTTRAPMA